MKTVNLVPRWYTQQRRQARLLHLHLVTMLLLGGAMVAAGFVARQRIDVLLQQRSALEGRMTQVSDPENILKTKQVELHRLTDLRMAYRELGKTIPMSAVIQQLQNDMGKGMALSHVSIEVRPDPVKGSGFVGDLRNPPRYHDVAYLGVEGLAPDDQLIYHLIEKLSSNPLFADVTLDYVRTGTMQGFMVRRFEIKMKMDLERLTTEDPDADAKKLASGGPDHAQ